MGIVSPTWGSFLYSSQAYLSWKCLIGCKPTSKCLILPGRRPPIILSHETKTTKEGWGWGIQHLSLSSPWAVLISLLPTPPPPSRLYQGYHHTPVFPWPPLGCLLCHDSCCGFPRAGGSMICFLSSAHLLISCLRNVSSSQELSLLRHLA